MLDLDRVLEYRDHRSQVSGTQSLLVHFSLASGTQSLLIHFSQASGTQSLQVYFSQGSRYPKFTSSL
jgi:hypothetical protein